MKLDRYDAQLALVFFLVSLILSMIGINWGIPSHERMQFYPHDVALYEEVKDPATTLYWIRPYESYHPDETFVLDALANMSPNEMDFNPRFFNYPTLSIYLTAVGLKSAEISNYITIVNDKEFYLDNPDQMGRIYRIGRIVSAILAAIGVSALYLTTKTLYQRRTIALFAGIILAIMPLWVRNAHFMLVNVPAATWMTLAALMAALAIQTEHKRWLYLSALCAGLATSTRYTSAAIIALTLFALIDLIRKNRSFLPHLSALILFPLGFLMGTPYALLDSAQFMNDLFYEGSGKLGISSAERLIRHMIFSEGTLLFLLSMVGLILLLQRWRTWQTPFVALFFLAGLGQSIISDLDFVRYFIPALPPLAIAAGLTLETIQEALAKRTAPAIGWGVALLFLLPTLLYTSELLYHMAQPDVRTQAAAWIEEMIPEQTELGLYQSLYYHSPPINHDKYPIVYMGHLNDAPPPPVIVKPSSLENLWGGALPPLTYHMVNFSQQPNMLWIWPLRLAPHDWAYTTLDIDIYHTPSLLVQER